MNVEKIENKKGSEYFKALAKEPMKTKQDVIDRTNIAKKHYVDNGWPDDHHTFGYCLVVIGANCYTPNRMKEYEMAEEINNDLLKKHGTKALDDLFSQLGIKV